MHEDDEQNRITVTVSVEDDYLSKFAQVARSCTRAGMKISERLPDIGILIGTILATSLARLSAVKGVAAVEVARGYSIPPPESEIQ